MFIGLLQGGGEGLGAGFRALPEAELWHVFFFFWLGGGGGTLSSGSRIERLGPERKV